MRELGSFDSNRSENHLRCLLFVILMFAVRAIVIQSLQAEQLITLAKGPMESAQSNISSTLAPCASVFIDEYFEDPDPISLLLPEVPRSAADFVETLMKQLHVSSSVYLLDARYLTDTTPKYDDISSTNVVILLDSAVALEDGDLSFANYCGRDCNFTIVLTSSFDDQESFLSDAGLLTQGMWLRSILDFAILASLEDETVLFAESFAIRIGRSYTPAKPRLLGRCERIADAAIRWNFVESKSVHDVVATSMNAAIFDHFPYAYSFINDKAVSDQLVFGGIEGWMVEEIARSMGIQLSREILEGTDSDMVQEELHLRLNNATDDLVFGGLIWYPNAETQYTISYGVVHVAWLVPKLPNVSLRGLISSFRPNVWYTIICTFVIGGFARFFVRDISLLDIIALFLGISIKRQPTRTSGRFQFISWAILGFFLTQFYLGSLADQLIRTTDEQIDSMQELVDSGLTLGGLEQFLDLLHVYNETDKHEQIIKAIHDKYIVFNKRSYIKQLMDLKEGRNSTLALLVMLNLTDVHYKSSEKNIHVIKQTLGTYPLALGTWTGFPYLKEFNYKIQVLVQAGLIRFWSNLAVLYHERYYEKSDDDENSDILELSDIAAAFFLLLIGYFAGFFLLIAEVIFYPSRILT